MSVINSVLKDLEARESGFTPIEIDSVAAAPVIRRERRPLLLAAAMVLLLAAAAWIYLQLQTLPAIAAPQAQPASNQQSVVAVAATPGPVQSKIAEAPEAQEASPQPRTVVEDTAVEIADMDNSAPAETSSPNRIVGLQIRESEQEMRMEFVLTEKVVAYLRERGENSFGYHLRDIESQIDAPLISNNPWIRTLDIESGEEGVDIRFETEAEILVETRQKFIDDEPVWAISLRKAMTSPLLAEASTESNNKAEEAVAPAQGETPELAETTVKDQPPVAQAEVRLDIKTSNPNAKAGNQLGYASRLIASGRHADAEKLLRELLDGVVDYQARRRLLALYQGLQQRESFDKLALESANRYPQDPVFKTEYARALFQAADYRAVVELFAEQPSLDANQQALLAASYQRLDEHDNAIRHYRLALRQDTANAKNWIGLGISQEHSARLAAALDSYQRAGKIGRLNERLQAFVDQRSNTLRQVLN